jgi:hypothetical protein
MRILNLAGGKSVTRFFPPGSRRLVAARKHMPVKSAKQSSNHKWRKRGLRVLRKGNAGAGSREYSTSRLQLTLPSWANIQGISHS